MRIRILLVVLMFLVSVVPFASAAGIKNGAKCPVEGFIQTKGESTFRCVKSGKKLTWKKLEQKVIKYDVKQIQSTDGGYLDNIIWGPCAKDPLLPKEWAEFEKFATSILGCAGQLRLAKYELGLTRPTSKVDVASKFSDLSKCKIEIPNDRKGLSFATDAWRENRKSPGPNSVIQLIPIYSEDSTKPINSPEVDYGKYLNYMKEWIDYSSDFGSNVELRIPKEYFKFEHKIGDYLLYHKQNWDFEGHVRFNKDVVATVDASIDFKGVDIAIVVAPPGTDARIMQQAGIGPLKTDEGYVVNAFSEFADLPSKPMGSLYIILSHPFWWLHEAYHTGYGFDDHYGDNKRNINTEYGLGWWTMMTPFGGDLSIWEKWKIGFVRDSQFQCANPLETSTHWIAPSSVRTQESKAVVIPINSTKVVVVESIRSAGLHYKTPAENQGALVYEIDFTQTEHGLGMKLALPNNRKIESTQFFLSDAPLRQGDYTTTNGLKISVVEAGTFGDVIKVEKICELNATFDQ